MWCQVEHRIKTRLKGKEKENGKDRVKEKEKGKRKRKSKRKTKTKTKTETKAKATTKTKTNTKTKTTTKCKRKKNRTILPGEGVGMSNFITTTGDFFQNVKNGFWVDHYYDITTSKMAFELITTTTKKDFRCSDFTYGVKKDHNVENQNINYQGD
jgi:hypothetical protein